MAPTLEKLFTMRLYRSASDTLVLGSSRGSGFRITAPYESGSLRFTPTGDSTAGISDPISASLVQGGSNSLRFDEKAVPAPTTFLDARVHFRDDALGAAFSVRFEGVARSDDLVQKILDGSPEARTTESFEHYEFNHPIFEVSRDEDRWMESTAWVGHGHYVVERQGEKTDVAVEFELYRLLTG